MRAPEERCSTGTCCTAAGSSLRLTSKKRDGADGASCAAASPDPAHHNAKQIRALFTGLQYKPYSPGGKRRAVASQILRAERFENPFMTETFSRTFGRNSC